MLTKSEYCSLKTFSVSQILHVTHRKINHDKQTRCVHYCLNVFKPPPITIFRLPPENSLGTPFAFHQIFSARPNPICPNDVVSNDIPPLKRA